MILKYKCCNLITFYSAWMRESSVLVVLLLWIISEAELIYFMKQCSVITDETENLHENRQDHPRFSQTKRINAI